MTAKLRLADRVNDLLPILGFGAAIASLAMPLNPFLVGVILAGSVIAAVHHAEVVAHRVGGQVVGLRELVGRLQQHREDLQHRPRARP